MNHKGIQPDAHDVDDRYRWVYPVTLAALVVAVFANSMWGVFVFDDGAILQNQRLHQLWPLSFTLGDTTRPLLRYSLALNWAISSDNPWSYHVVNLLVHTCAALALFGVVRRTMQLPRFDAALRNSAWPISWAIAALWATHPLQTESVTFVVQRAESMMGMWYLLTIYSVVRRAIGGGAIWSVAAILTCTLGMATKEVMATAPLVLLLFDVAFLSGSLSRTWRRRGLLHACLWLTVGIVLWLWSFNIAPETKLTAGFSYRGVTPWAYALSQPAVVLHYLRLVVWPHPLCLDYGWPVAQGLAPIAIPTAAMLLWLCASVWAYRRGYAAGFLGLCFLVVLVPSSSVVPISVIAAEHRMYLPLACIVTLLVIGTWRFLATRRSPSQTTRAMACVVGIAIAVLSSATVYRNTQFQDGLRIWHSAVTHYPNSFRARINLGNAYLDRGDVVRAMPHYVAAVSLRPDSSKALYALGNAQRAAGRLDIATKLCARAVALGPGVADAHNALGRCKMESGRVAEGIASLKEAVRLNSSLADAHNNLGIAFLTAGDLAASAGAFRESLRLNPGLRHARINLGKVFIMQGKLEEGARELERVLDKHADPAALQNLAVARVSQGRLEDAARHLREALRLHDLVRGSSNTDVANCRADLERITARLRDIAKSKRANAGD